MTSLVVGFRFAVDKSKAGQELNVLEICGSEWQEHGLKPVPRLADLNCEGGSSHSVILSEAKDLSSIDASCGVLAR